MKIYPLITFILTNILLHSFVLAQTPPQPTLSGTLSNRLEFTEQIGNYFSSELSTSPQLATSPDTDEDLPKTRIKIESFYLENGEWRVTFEFPKPVTVEEDHEEYSLLLTFNQPIDSRDFEKVQENLGYLIKKLSTGYNTLYIVAKRPVSYQIDKCDQSIALTITPHYEIPTAASKNLKGAYARLLSEERNYKPALNALQKLEGEYEGDKDIQILHATLEGLLPRWKRDLNILTNLHEQYPEDEDVTKFMWEVYTPHSPFIKVQRQMQQTVGLAAVQVYQVNGEDIVYNDPWKTWYWGAKYQLYSGHILGILNNQGEAVGFRGRRSQGTVFVRRDNEDGSHVTALAYGQEGALGVGGEVEFLLPSIQGTCNIAADWHRPYWAVFETLAYNGREDRFMLQLNSVCNRYFTVAFEGGAHRVGITGTPNGFSSILASAQVFFNMIIPNPIIGVNYSFNAEYVFQRTTKLGADGNKYNPVPYTSFEDHTITAYLYYIWRERWYLSAFGGETFNRLGINAPTGGISLKYIKPNPCGWEIELSAVQFPSTTNQGATSNYITGSFTARF